MPINVSWIVALIAVVLAIMTWAKTKRVGPAVGVFIGGVLIIVLSDPSMLTSMAEAAKRLIQTGIDQGISR